MIYVPQINDYACYVVTSDSVIRAYKTIPQRNSDVEYRDYYYTSNYLYKDGIQSFSQYSQLPICLDNSVLSSEVWYRNDYDSILIIFAIMFIFVIYFPLKIFFKFFRRFKI